MHRGYTAERYLERLAAARRAIDDLAVTTDIIVGFPGETDADFERTLEVAAAAEYDSAYTFIFSPRPGTEAADMADDFVDPTSSPSGSSGSGRSSSAARSRKHEARVGRVEEVLVEGPSKQGPGRAHRPHRPEQARPLRQRRRRSGAGSYATVEVTGAAPHHLARRAASRSSPWPPHRTRIPVAAG